MVTAHREADIRTTIQDGGETSIRYVEKRAANGQYSLWGWDTARERQYDGFSFVQIRRFLDQPASRDGLTE